MTFTSHTCDFIFIFIDQSINENVYSYPSRFLLRGAPDPGQAENKSLEKVVELRTSTVCEVSYIYWKSMIDDSIVSICQSLQINLLSETTSSNAILQ